MGHRAGFGTVPTQNMNYINIGSNCEMSLKPGTAGPAKQAAFAGPLGFGDSFLLPEMPDLSTESAMLLGSHGTA